MKNIIKIAAVAALALAPSAALAGKGGSAAAIQAAVSSKSTDAIIAEIERAENLMCDACVQTITNLTEDSRFAVREVAAWWFARRPILKDMLATQFVGELPTGDTIKVRNAADFLGATKTYTALPQLRAAIHRGDLGTEAKLALVRAAGYMAHTGGNEVLTTAMADGDASVRAAAIVAWRDVLGQKTAQPVIASLGDADANVRAARSRRSSSAIRTPRSAATPRGRSASSATPARAPRWCRRPPTRAAWSAASRRPRSRACTERRVKPVDWM